MKTDKNKKYDIEELIENICLITAFILTCITIYIIRIKFKVNNVSDLCVLATQLDYSIFVLYCLYIRNKK